MQPTSRYIYIYQESKYASYNFKVIPIDGQSKYLKLGSSATCYFHARVDAFSAKKTYIYPCIEIQIIQSNRKVC